VKEVALKILKNGHVYITRSVITQFLPLEPDVHVVMESQQCIPAEDILLMALDFVDFVVNHLLHILLRITIGCLLNL